MRLSFRVYIGFFCASMLLVISSWYFSREAPKVKLDADSLALTPDLYVQTLTVKKYNENGILLNKLVSPFMEHFPKDNSHVFKTPHIFITQEDKSTMDIHSLKARAIHGGEQITFTEDVVVHQNPGKNKAPSVMKTEKIIYNSKDKIAKTDLAVSLEQAGNTIHSTGMIAWLTEKRVKLLNQARGRYVPKNG